MTAATSDTLTPRAVPVEITDSTVVPEYPDGWLHRWCERALYEPRDEVFVRLTIRMLLLMPSLMALAWAALRYAPVPKLVVFAAYLAVWGWFVPPVILMLHCTMHRPFIRKPKILDKAHLYAMSLLFGMPTGYREHHVGMHHFEDNMPEDLSSTRAYQRDSFLQFLVYFSRLLFLGLVEVPLYLYRRRRYAMARRAFVSEIVHLAVIVLAMRFDPWFGVTVFLAPYVVCRFAMMVGNWGQHAFLNDALDNDGMSNSITCINSTYNRRCFNDGYHIGHHLKATRHWTDLPVDFQKNQASYAQKGAIVFEGIDFFMVSLFLWTGQYKRLAKHYVRLDGVAKTDEEVIEMLRARVRPLPVPEAVRA